MQNLMKKLLSKIFIPVVILFVIFYGVIGIINGEVRIFSYIFQTKFNSIPREDIQVFVINLDRTPERYVKVKSQLDQIGMAHQRFSAVDGYDIQITHQKTGQRFLGKDLTSGKMKIIPNEYYDISCPSDTSRYFSSGHMLLTAGELGCHCSHREILNQIVSNEIKYALIFEDDVTFPKEFQKNFLKLIDSLPKKWDIVYLYAKAAPAKKLKVINNPNIIKFRPDNNPVHGTVGYLITHSAAKEILMATKNFSYSIDNSISSAINSKKIQAYQGIKCHLLTPNGFVERDSVIRIMGRAF